jgi:tetratricopeptide (TPR) repeat protein
MTPALQRAKEIADDQPDEALRICNDVMNDHYDDIDGQIALFMAAYIMMQAERFGIAYHLYARCAELRPHQSEIYSNMGMCIEDTDPDKAIELFKKAQQLEPDNALAIANEGLMWQRLARPDKSVECCTKALRIKPDLIAAKHNRSLANLMLRNFKEGWREYADTLGVKHREKRDYGLPEWDGKRAGKVVVYGEQGVGDEIMFTSCLGDIKNEVVLDCDKRLETLFRRSFPDVSVYGTRFSDSTPLVDEHELEWQCAIGQLPSFYRRDEKSFTGKAYLKPDPQHVVMYRALFDTFKGKKIGIAWNGGLKNTGKTVRSLNIEDLAPIFDEDNTYISLEYKPVSSDVIEQYGLKVFPRVTGKGNDIDELAGLISQLDCVITCCTTVVYIAGALGIPCYVLTPSRPGYRYHVKGGFPWYNSVYLHRQKTGESWFDCVSRLGDVSAKNIHRLRQA